jgi:CPA1 family monovalent cation:H+ antiporter
MRGVVTLAIALSLPEAMPGRDLILAAAFAVILVTVMVQGATIGPMIRLLGLQAAEAENIRQLRHEQAMERMAAAQFSAVERLSQQPDGSQKHPRLLEQYGYRVRMTERYSREAKARAGDRREHFEVVLSAIAAGRGGDLETAPIGDDPRRSPAHPGIRPRPAGAHGARGPVVKMASQCGTEAVPTAARGCWPPARLL